jgi:hypothetical protein
VEHLILGHAYDEYFVLAYKPGMTVKPHSSIFGQIILQCGEASANDASKLRMFPLSLSSTAFTWFTSFSS